MERNAKVATVLPEFLLLIANCVHFHPSLVSAMFARLTAANSIILVLRLHTLSAENGVVCNVPVMRTWMAGGHAIAGMIGPSERATERAIRSRCRLDLGQPL